MKFLQVLAFWPAVLSAHTLPVELQDTIGIQQAFEVTALASTTLRVRNELPVRVAVQVDHTRTSREKGGSARNTYTWGFIEPNKTSNDVNVTYETLRKAGDVWNVKIMFDNPKWNITALDCERSIFIEDEKPTLVLRRDQTRFEFGDVHWYWTEPFSLVNPNSRADPNLDSFFFVEAGSEYKDVTSVEVQLQTQQGFLQKQSFTIGAGKNSSAPLPFFFQKGGTKDYNETWTFKVNRKGLRPLVAENVTCQMTADLAGQRTGLFFDRDSWAFGDLKSTKCFDWWWGTSDFGDEL